LRSGSYSADLSVVPGPPNPGRFVRLGWVVSLTLKSDKRDQTVGLNTLSGSPIDAGVNAGIGTSFESHGNKIIDIKESGFLPIFDVQVTSTYWHGDFVHQSNDPIYIPKNVTIGLQVNR
jgi:hypothetical protein